MIFVCDALPPPIPPPPPSPIATAAVVEVYDADAFAFNGGVSVGLQVEWNMLLNKLNREIIRWSVVGFVKNTIRIYITLISCMQIYRCVCVCVYVSERYIIFLRDRKLIISCFFILFDEYFVRNAFTHAYNLYLKSVNFQRYIIFCDVIYCIFIYIYQCTSA